MRKLASVQRIIDIKPIPNADKICAYKVLGWWVVDLIDKYKIGDKVVYFEIDSWIPHIIAPFLTKEGHEVKKFNNVEGQRLRTVKLKGQLSQGLILPKSIIDYPFKEGDDVSEFLGIQKYEQPLIGNNQLNAKNLFPSFIPKTDEERIQNLSNEYHELKKYRYEVTEKLDGTSLTVFYKDGVFGVCSRNLELKLDVENWYTSAALKNDLYNKLLDLNRNIAIQGEIIGVGIQKNKYKLTDQKLYVFNIYDIDKQVYFNASDRTTLCRILDLLQVPTISDNFEIKIELDELLTFAEGHSCLNAKTEREGLVFKCISDPTIHFKAISNKFLLKED